MLILKNKRKRKNLEVTNEVQFILFSPRECNLA